MKANRSGKFRVVRLIVASFIPSLAMSNGTVHHHVVLLDSIEKGYRAAGDEREAK